MHLPVIEDPSWGGRYCNNTSQADATNQDRIQEATNATHQNQIYIYIYTYISAQNELLCTITEREC